MKYTFLLLATLVLLSSCAPSNDNILGKTIERLNNIETVEYQSTLQMTENGEVVISETDIMYFDFTDNKVKYHSKYERGERIYNGDQILTSNNETSMSNF